MKQSLLFTKTSKTSPKDETSINAQLLVRAGYVHKEMAGVYSYLPLGQRVLQKIQDIIRKELNAIGANEISMTALQSKELWQSSDRWSDEIVDNWFKTTLKNGTELGLAFTHEEPAAAIMKQFVSSYKDLPALAYQFQTKFRNELRAKSGIMRGREFLMKDLYSFHTNEEEHKKCYDLMKQVYTTIFTKLGLGQNTYMTLSSGQPFSTYSYEFQTLSDAGEDTILYDKEKGLAINEQDFSDTLFKDFGLNKDDYTFKKGKSIEVGDIYSLGTKYSEAVGLQYADEENTMHPVYMGSYGIGVSRIMGALVEVHHDDAGIIWPKEVAPFAVHLISLCQDKDTQKAEQLYQELIDQGVEVLYDDRQDVRPGQKFADSDLIGIPTRLVISKKTIEQQVIEYKDRRSADTQMISKTELMKRL